MSIEKITIDFAGQIGVEPRVIRIKTTNTQAEILAPNFLQGAIQMGYSFYPTDAAFVSVTDNVTDLYRISITPSEITLVPSVTQISGTHATTWSGPIPATPGNIIYRKTGNLVTLLFPSVLADGNNTENNISIDTVLPASLRPILIIQEIKIVQTNGDLNRDAGMVQISNTGQIDWGINADFTAFAAVTTEIGFAPMTVTYPVA